MEGLFQVMPPLSADEYAELLADIQARGVMVPIEYDEAGNILDGHHRVKACSEGLSEQLQQTHGDQGVLFARDGGYFPDTN